uniref:Theromacin n=1 Tax=Hirudo medicinalis TaxID=6421 RepID=THMAC_HIRME
GCFEDWSRCSPSTASATGVLWRSCDSYCKVCFKADRGECYDSPSLNCPHRLPNNKQCRCINARTAKDNRNPTCWA